MTREEVLEKLQGVFWEVFDDESIQIGPDTAADDIEDWDSLEQINLIVAIEKKFQIKFSIGEAGNMKNTGEMADAILKKISKRTV